MEGRPMTLRFAPALLAAGAALCAVGCARLNPMMRADLRALDLPQPELKEDHFQRDRAGGISEEGLRAVLAAPIDVDQTQRLGVVAVAQRYQPVRVMPLAAVTAQLANAVESAGLFQAASEVSTDWPVDHGVAGLRELAARYR